MKRLPAVIWRIAICALLVLLLLKWGVVDGYEVHGNSMEPLLIDRDSGADHVAVFKRHFDMFPPRRFDLVVFEPGAEGADDGAELGGDLFVKRIWGLPGEDVLIRAGDVWIGTDGAPPGPISRTPRQVESMLVPVASLRAAPDRFALRDAPAPAGLPCALAASDGDEAMLRYTLPVDDGWTARDGQPVRGTHLVNDCALRVCAELDEGAVLRLELREGGDVFAATLSCGGGATLERDAGPAPSVLARTEPNDVVVRANRAFTVLFYNVDDSVRLVVDGTVCLGADYPANTDVLGLRSNAPAAGLTAGAGRILDLDVLRDVYVTDAGVHAVTGAPYRVPADTYFVLGDNSANSRDSRQFGSISRSAIEGRPFLLFLPLRRLRFL